MFHGNEGHDVFQLVKNFHDRTIGDYYFVLASRTLDSQNFSHNATNT